MNNQCAGVALAGGYPACSTCEDWIARGGQDFLSPEPAFGRAPAQSARGLRVSRDGDRVAGILEISVAWIGGELPITSDAGGAAWVWMAPIPARVAGPIND